MKGLKTVSVVDALVSSLRTRVLDGRDRRRGRADRNRCRDGVRGVPADREDGDQSAGAGRPVAAGGPQVGPRAEPVPRRRGGPVPGAHPARAGGRPAGGRRQPFPRRPARRCGIWPPSAPAPGTASSSRRICGSIGCWSARSDSPRLTRLYQALSGEIHLSMVQSRYALGRDRIVAEHGGVLTALEQHDAAAAEVTDARPSGGRPGRPRRAVRSVGRAGPLTRRKRHEPLDHSQPQSANSRPCAPGR